MSIKTREGFDYQPTGSLQQFDPENPEIDLINLWDAESIRIGGSPIFYYEVFIQSGTVDPLYVEDRGKIFSNNPVQLYCTYDPTASQNLMGQFGIDGLSEMTFEFNYREVLSLLGKEPKIGSRLYTPHLKENWTIVQRNLGEFKLWTAMRLQLFCQKFQESVTTGEGRVTSSGQVDFSIIPKSSSL